MSYPFVPQPTLEGAARKGSRIPAAMLGVLAAGLVLVLPGQARADGYGHAEITLGLPHGAITVGRTWEDPPRQVVVEQVTHNYPEADDEAEADEDAIYEDEADEADVIIEKRRFCPRPKRVTIIERYEEEPVHVVRYVERPSCGPQVVVLRRPRVHVVHAGPTVIVAPRAGYHGGGWRSGGHGGGSYKYKNSGGSYGGGHRDLFPDDGGRPTRVRGVGHKLVQVGSHH